MRPSLADLWVKAHRQPCRCIQLDAELTAWVGQLQRLAPARYLEIGADEGGTLYHALQVIQPGGVAAVISTGADAHMATWQAWASARQILLRVFDGRSNTAEGRAFLKEHGPYDAALIDGDHRYTVARADWRAVAAAMRPGGLVALHDIEPNTAPVAGPIEVPQLWAEIASAHTTVEHIAARGLGYGYGIGVVTMPDNIPAEEEDDHGE